MTDWSAGHTVRFRYGSTYFFSGRSSAEPNDEMSAKFTSAQTAKLCPIAKRQKKNNRPSSRDNSTRPPRNAVCVPFSEGLDSKSTHHREKPRGCHLHRIRINQMVFCIIYRFNVDMIAFEEGREVVEFGLCSSAKAAGGGANVCNFCMLCRYIGFNSFFLSNFTLMCIF